MLTATAITTGPTTAASPSATRIASPRCSPGEVSITVFTHALVRRVGGGPGEGVVVRDGPGAQPAPVGAQPDLVRAVETGLQPRVGGAHPAGEEQLERLGGGGLPADVHLVGGHDVQTHLLVRGGHRAQPDRVDRLGRVEAQAHRRQGPVEALVGRLRGQPHREDAPALVQIVLEGPDQVRAIGVAVVDQPGGERARVVAGQGHHVEGADRRARLHLHRVVGIGRGARPERVGAGQSGGPVLHVLGARERVVVQIHDGVGGAQPDAGARRRRHDPGDVVGAGVHRHDHRNGLARAVPGQRARLAGDVAVGGVDDGPAGAGHGRAGHEPQRAREGQHEEQSQRGRRGASERPRAGGRRDHVSTIPEGRRPCPGPVHPPRAVRPMGGGRGSARSGQSPTPRGAAHGPPRHRPGRHSPSTPARCGS